MITTSFNNPKKRIIINPNLTSFSDYLDFFVQEILPARLIAEKTLREYVTRIPHIKSFFGDCDIEQITVNDIANFLNKYPPQQSNHYRTFLVFIFNHIQAHGLCYGNPAAVTLPKQIQIQRKPLSEASFWLIHRVAPQFLKYAMELALTTLLRRDDICNLQFSQVNDGFLWVSTRKTKAALKIKVNQPLKDILNKCKNDGIDSPYVIHKKFFMRKLHNKQHVTQIIPDYLTKEFSKARDKTGLFSGLEAYTRPTFHEVRGLGAHLYEINGVPKHKIQALLGHADPDMTERYLAKHQDRFTEICLD